MSATRPPYLQRGAAVTANLRFAQQLELESQSLPGSRTMTPIRETTKETPKETTISTSIPSKRYPWQTLFLKRDRVPHDNEEWMAEMETLEIYRQKSAHVPKDELTRLDNAEWIRNVIYMIMESGLYYDWQDARKKANRGKIEEMGKVLYWKTGVLLSAEEVLSVWRKGRRWVRETLDKCLKAGLSDSEIEIEFRKASAYPYLRFARALFVTYEVEMRTRYGGGEANEELIQQTEDDDDIIFDSFHVSEHQMTYTCIKSEMRKNRQDNNREDSNVDDSVPAPAPSPSPPPPPPTEPSRRRRAPSNEPNEASPSKIRVRPPAPEATPNQFRAPPQPVHVAPQVSHFEQVTQACAAAAAQEGFASGFSPSGFQPSRSQTPYSPHSTEQARESKPGPLYVHHQPVEQQIQWSPMVNPLNASGVYEDGRSQDNAIAETCKLLLDRLTYCFNDTQHKKSFNDLIRIIADTAEQEGKMDTVEFIHECMIKSRIANENPKTK